MNKLNSTLNEPIDDTSLLVHTVRAVQLAGLAMQTRFRGDARPIDRNDISTRIATNDKISRDILKSVLGDADPSARWDDDEDGVGALPSGAWWVTDPVEGAINHIHGLPEWGITATLVRDNQAVLTAVHIPFSGETYTALRGEGAWLNGKPLRASEKTHLNAATVGTGQAVPDEGEAIFQRIGLSVSAMLNAALVVRVSVPSTLQLVQVAAGRQDLFWQYSQVRSGLLAGALLVSEAGGIVTDLHGQAWNISSGGMVAGASALINPAIAALASVA